MIKTLNLKNIAEDYYRYLNQQEKNTIGALALTTGIGYDTIRRFKERFKTQESKIDMDRCIAIKRLLVFLAEAMGRDFNYYFKN